MLLFRKTTLLGAAVMLPVIMNIVLINLFFSIALGALCTSAFIFASALAILWHQCNLLVSAFWTHQADEPAEIRRRYRITAAAVVLLIITFMGVAFWLEAGSRILK